MRRIEIPLEAFSLEWKKSTLFIAFERDGRFINSVQRPTVSTINRNLQKFRIKLAVSLRNQSDGSYQPKIVKMKMVITYRDESYTMYAMLPMHELVILGTKEGGESDGTKQPIYVPLTTRKPNTALKATTTAYPVAGSQSSTPSNVSENIAEAAIRGSSADVSEELSFAESDVADDKQNFEAVEGAGMRVFVASVVGEGGTPMKTKPHVAPPAPAQVGGRAGHNVEDIEVAVGSNSATQVLAIKSVADGSKSIENVPTGAAKGGATSTVPVPNSSDSGSRLVSRCWYGLSTPVRLAIVLLGFCCYVLMLPACELARRRALVDVAAACSACPDSLLCSLGASLDRENAASHTLQRNHAEVSDGKSSRSHDKKDAAIEHKDTSNTMNWLWSSVSIDGKAVPTPVFSLFERAPAKEEPLHVSVKVNKDNHSLRPERVRRRIGEFLGR